MPPKGSKVAPKRKRAESEKLSAITPITDTDIADTMPPDTAEDIAEIVPGASPLHDSIGAGMPAARPGKTMYEVKEWNTEQTDKGWKGDLIGIMFNTKDKRVQETWKWTEPPTCPACLRLRPSPPTMEKCPSAGDVEKDAGKGKVKARGNNAKGKGKTTKGKGKASAGKGKGKK